MRQQLDIGDIVDAHEVDIVAFQYHAGDQASDAPEPVYADLDAHSSLLPDMMRAALAVQRDWTDNYCITRRLKAQPEVPPSKASA